MLTDNIYIYRRRITQAIGELSAGSVFWNPTNLGVSEAELIDKTGLKGSSVGATVSHIQCHFLVNIGGSTLRYAQSHCFGQEQG